MAMLTAMPMYSAMTPRENRMAPVPSISTIIVDVQPGASDAGWRARR